MKLSFAMVFFLVMFVLKVTGYLAISWIWVTSPLWIPLILLAVAYGLYGLAWLIDRPGRNRLKADVQKLIKNRGSK